MAYKLFSSIFLLISSLVFVGFSQQGGGGGSPSLLPCVQKLLPCQASLQAHSSSPPASCCIPLKQVIASDPKCLCDVLDNPALMKGLNITQDDALNLAKACNANADTSVCKTVAGPPTKSPRTPATPSTPSKSNGSSTATPSTNAGGGVGMTAGLGVSVAISFAQFLLFSVTGSI